LKGKHNFWLEMPKWQELLKKGSQKQCLVGSWEKFWGEISQFYSFFD
jgi:hypothetical protein